MCQRASGNSIWRGRSNCVRALVVAVFSRSTIGRTIKYILGKRKEPENNKSKERKRKKDSKTSYLCIVIPWRFPSILPHGTPAGNERSVIHALAAGAAAARRESQRKSKFDPCHSISAMQAARCRRPRSSSFILYHSSIVWQASHFD